MIKSKLLLVIICIILLSQSAFAHINFYPPQADFNWQQGDHSVTGTTTSITDDRIYLTLKNPGARNYIVTDVVDLTNVMSLVVTWKGDWIWTAPWYVGNITFGISTSQVNDRFDAYINYDSTDFNTMETLDVSSYTGNYYLKVGGNITVADFANHMYIWLYNVTGYNMTRSTALNATSIEETTATLNGILEDDSDVECTCGFWYGNVSNVNEGNAIDNVTATGTYNIGDSFSKGISSLVSGEYYYVRTWTSNVFGFNASENQTYFLTIPYAPSGFHVVTSAANNVTLSWTNATLPQDAVMNHSVLIQYKKGNIPPSSISDGNFGGNISQWANVTITGLEEESTYSFSAWTYINASGSPSISHWSSEYTTIAGSTHGGIYNISVRYENMSWGLVDLSNYRIHKLIAYYEDEIDYVTFTDGVVDSGSLTGDFSDIAEGNFTIVTDKTVKWFEFRWNDSYNSSFYCFRTIVPPTNQYNITFYIRTNLPVYGQGISKTIHTNSKSVTDPTSSLTIDTTYELDEVYAVSVYNISGYGEWVIVPNNNYSISGNQVTIDAWAFSINTTMAKIEYYTYEIITDVTGSMDDALVRYTYSFLDETGLFCHPNDPLVIIYTFDSEGNKQIIHSEYFDVEGKVHPWLVFDTIYFIGVSCNVLTYERIGIAPASSNLEPSDIVIPYITDLTYGFFDLITLDFGWYADGFYVLYQDTTFTTTEVTFYVYDYWNETLVHSENSSFSTKNFTFTTGEGCNLSLPYKFNIVANLSGDYNGTYSLGTHACFSIFDIEEPVTNLSNLDDLLEIIFGKTPIYGEWHGQEVEAHWTYIVVFSLSFIALMTFGKLNAFLGSLSVGLILAFSGVLIQYMDVLYTESESGVVGYPGATIAIIGGLIVALSIIGLLGGVDRT